MPYIPKTKEQKDRERRKYFAQQNILTKDEKKIVQFYELQWTLRTNVPTIEQVSKFCNITQVNVNHALTRRPVIKALEQRGIPWRQHSQSELTATQIAAAIVMGTPDGRTTLQKLDELGILSETYFAWLADPQFKNMVDNVTQRNLGNIREVAVAELMTKIAKGDWQAIRYYLDVTGEFVNTDTPQSEQLIKMLIEIIQRHVKDPAIITAIAQDIKLASGNRTLEVVSPPALEHEPISGQVVEDLELERAKKMLNLG